MSVTAIANQIRAGSIDIGLAIGAESMSEKSVRALPLMHSASLTSE